MRILILEDDLLTALDLQLTVEGAGHEVVGPFGTIAAARAAAATGPDFAFLDIDLPDGRSYDLAAELDRAGIPVAFVSASNRADLPAGVRDFPFVSKPFAHSALRNVLNVDRRVA